MQREGKIERDGGQVETKVCICSRSKGHADNQKRKEKQKREEQIAVLEVERAFLREYCLDFSENFQRDSAKQAALSKLEKRRCFC